jgi:hypothetical protein
LGSSRNDLVTGAHPLGPETSILHQLKTPPKFGLNSLFFLWTWLDQSSETTHDDLTLSPLSILHWNICANYFKVFFAWD